MFMHTFRPRRYTPISQDTHLNEDLGEEKKADTHSFSQRKQLLDYAGLILLALVCGSVGFVAGRHHPLTREPLPPSDNVVPQGR